MTDSNGFIGMAEFVQGTAKQVLYIRQKTSKPKNKDEFDNKTDGQALRKIKRQI